MSKKNKKFQIISETIEDLKRQLEQKPTEKKIYCLFKLRGPLYECDDESYSSVEEFMQIKGVDEKRDMIVIFRLASEDPNIEEHRRKEPTSIH